MSNVKVSAMTAILRGAIDPAADYLHLVDTSAGTSGDRKVAPAELAAAAFASALPYPAGKTLWVDSVNGSDTTGARQRPDLPFLTLAAAKAAASSGDTVVVGPGSYAVTATLAANGVHWHFLPGCTITRTNTGTADVSIFDDGGSAMTFNVTGRGDFVLAGTIQAGVVHSIVKLTNASSDVRFQCRSLYNNSAVGTLGIGNCVYQENGVVHVTADTMRSGTLAVQPYLVYWRNGEMRVKVGLMQGTTGIAVGCDSLGTLTGDCFVDAGEIRYTTGVLGLGCVFNAAADAEAKLWLTCPLISCNQGAISVSGGKSYITAQKIAGCTASIAGNEGVIKVEGGKLWLNTQKITGTYESFVEMTGGTARITCLEYEDLGNMPQGFRNAGGTLILTGGEAVMAVGNGLAHASGTTRLRGLKLDTKAQSGKNPIVLTGSGCLIEQATVLVPATFAKSVTGTAQTITSYGAYARNIVDGSPPITVNGTLNADPWVQS